MSRLKRRDGDVQKSGSLLVVSRWTAVHAFEGGIVASMLVDEVCAEAGRCTQDAKRSQAQSRCQKNHLSHERMFPFGCQKATLRHPQGLVRLCFHWCEVIVILAYFINKSMFRPKNLVARLEGYCVA